MTERVNNSGLPLYELFRPRTWSEVVGNKKALRKIRSKIMRQRVRVVIHGEPGIGKSTLQRISLATIACSSPTADGEPCGVCYFCYNIFNYTTVGEVPCFKRSQLNGDTLKEIKRLAQYKLINWELSIVVVGIEDIDQAPERWLKDFMDLLDAHFNLMFIATAIDFQSLSAAFRGRCRPITLEWPSTPECTTWLYDVCQKLKIKIESEEVAVKLIENEGNNLRNILNGFEDLMDEDLHLNIKSLEYLDDSVSSVEETGRPRYTGGVTIEKEY